jgi:alpha-tubulin suppressor-like RCC1 family protein
MWCWGDNDLEELGTGSNMNSSVPVSVSGLASGVAAIGVGAAHSCALTTSGGVQCWGFNPQGELGNNLSNTAVRVAVSALSSGVSALATGNQHNCVLMTAGGVRCWGSNGSGELGNNSTTKSNVPVEVVEP